jgi:RHS repeat-associated protein
MPTSTRERLLSRYHYDPLDRLVNSTPFEQPTQRYYCQTRLATEIEGGVQRTIVQHDDQLLAQRQSEGGKTTATLLATDQQRSVLNALNANQPNPLAYSPYGHRPLENGLLSLLGFNGERPDPVTGHYHLGNGYRQFNPVLMRFNSPDSWSPFGEGGLNAYAYCGGNPVTRRDPNGHTWLAAFFKYLDGTLNASSNISHPTQQLSKTTRRLLSESAESLGGEQKITDIANSQGRNPVEFLINNSSITQPLRQNPIGVTFNSPLEHVDQNINTLIQREIALTDLQIALPRGATNFDFGNGLLQTQNLIDMNRNLRDSMLNRTRPPSYSLTMSNADPRYSPPLYEDPIVIKPRTR